MDPCASPYRMPLGILQEALRRVRLCGQGHSPYVNPSTNLSFLERKPYTTSSTDLLKPLRNSEHYESSRHVDIDRALREIPTHSTATSSRVPLYHRVHSLQRQSFVQHKIDGRDRAFDSELKNVYVVRDGHWYFSTFDRYVTISRLSPLQLRAHHRQVRFLWFEFGFSMGSGLERRKQFFFLPERELPDSFYDSLEEEQSFTRSNFECYRIVWDDLGDGYHVSSK